MSILTFAGVRIKLPIMPYIFAWTWSHGPFRLSKQKLPKYDATITRKRNMTQLLSINYCISLDAFLALRTC